MSMPCSSSLALTQNFLPAGALTPEETPCRKNSVEDGGGELLESPAYSPSHLDGSPMDDLDGEPVEKKAMDDILTACTPDTKHRVVVEGEALVVHERGEGHMPCEPDEAPALPSPDPETTQRAKRTRKSAPLALDSMPGVPVPSQPTGRSATKKRNKEAQAEGRGSSSKDNQGQSKGQSRSQGQSLAYQESTESKSQGQSLGKETCCSSQAKGKKTQGTQECGRSGDCHRSQASQCYLTSTSTCLWDFKVMFQELHCILFSLWCRSAMSFST